MKSRIRTAMLLSAVLLPAGLSAQFTEGIKIHGRVLYAKTMQPAENVMVELLRMSMMQERVYTDSRGEFEFIRLTMAEYVLRVRQEGHLPVEQTVNMNVEVGGRGSVFNVTLMLEPDPKAAGRGDAAGATVLSAREMQVPEAARKEFEKGFRELNERNQPERSVPHFQKAIALHAGYDEAYVQLALAFFLQRKRADSLRTLAKAIEVYPQNARAFALLGKVLIDTNQIEPGIQALEEALLLDETQWGAHADLGSALLYRKQTDAALQHARRALELNDQAPLTHVLLASVLMERKEHAEAVKVMDEFLRRFPNGQLAEQIRRQRDDARKLLTGK